MPQTALEWVGATIGAILWLPLMGLVLWGSWRVLRKFACWLRAVSQRGWDSHTNKM